MQLCNSLVDIANCLWKRPVASPRSSLTRLDLTRAIASTAIQCFPTSTTPTRMPFLDADIFETARIIIVELCITTKLVDQAADAAVHPPPPFPTWLQRQWIVATLLHPSGQRASWIPSLSLMRSAALSLATVKPM
ncbi:hypothetical protein GALMADRAFT_273244 [Galerina marginata CBS 339.88]|uniref:Uncharacterized protein n=1 Tax=Galerina marginata (strain CBS 339.88) TaxID=685588 RepID=A0A067SKD0_GALM3|nr:hypothetical protein GALMADRAFT_273244 [Galerina marginata CBS 339.88]